MSTRTGPDTLNGVHPAAFEGVDEGAAARVAARALELLLSNVAADVALRGELADLAAAVRAWAAAPGDAAARLRVDQGWLRVVSRYDRLDHVAPETQFSMSAAVDVGLLDPVPYARACTLALVRFGPDVWAAAVADELGVGGPVDARAAIELCRAGTRIDVAFAAARLLT